MRHLRLFFAALLLMPCLAGATSNLHEKEHRFGLGLAVDSLQGAASAKLFLHESLSVQATAGFWWGWGIVATGDLIFEAPQVWSNDRYAMNWYLGAGGGTTVGGRQEGVEIFPRARSVAGVSLQMRQRPLEFVIELRPGVVFHGDPAFDFSGGIVVRQYF